LDPFRTGTAGGTLVNEDRNIIIGQRAGIRAGNTSDGNVIIGGGAGQNLTTGADSNVIIGEFAASAGEDDFTGMYEVNMTADQLVIIGEAAAQNLTNASDGVFIGHYAARQLTTGTDNTFIGAEAGANCTTCFDTTLLGEEAGFSLVDGDDNTFIGEDAGYGIASGNRNTAVGSQALAGITTGTGDDDSYNNTAVGFQAGFNNGYPLGGGDDTTWNNTFVGSFAGIDNGGGRANTYIGAFAGENSEHSDYNTFVGAFAGWDNNRNNAITGEGNRNTYLGTAAGVANRRGNDNVILGALADFRSWQNVSETNLTENLDATGFQTFNTAGVQGSNLLEPNENINRVVIIGSLARSPKNDTITIGYSADTLERRSIAIGTEAQATHEDAIVIGHQAVSHGNNIAVIGNATTASIDPGADGVTALGSPTFRYADAYAETYHVSADSGADAVIDFVADAGNNNDDNWRIAAADSGDFTIETFANGTFIPSVTITNAGDLIVPGEISANSDERLKTNIKDLPAALSLVGKLQPKTFEWKPFLEKQPGKHYGLIAQEVEEVLPELVSTDDEGLKSVSYQELVPLLLGAVQELEAENKANQALLGELKQKQSMRRDIESRLSDLQVKIDDAYDLAQRHEHDEQ
jgi:hypothetical protein